MKTTGDNPVHAHAKSRRGEPAWDIALLFPFQGSWTETEYLALENNSENRMIELVNGYIEVLPMPDLYHQGIVGYIYRRLFEFVMQLKAGSVSFAPLPIRLWENQMREPDIIFIKSHRIKNRHKPPEGADLAIEVVSPGKENRQRDLKEKRRDYAKARIPEYWIVDPEEKRITVLRLSGKTYKTHGKFGPGDIATSLVLHGFAVDVDEVFAAGENV